MNYEIVCSSLGADRDKWLEERRYGLGGSDAATIMGLNPWSTPLELWAEKSGAVKSSEPGEAAYWGTVLEPLVLKRYTETSGRIAKPSGLMLRSVDRPWQLATLDGEQADDRGQGVLEIKCTGLKDRWEEGPPPYVLCQVQHQLAVTGWNWASVAALFNGREFWWGDIDRDDSYISRLNEAEEAFWNLVLMGKEPLAQAMDKDVLAKLHPQHAPGVIVELGQDFVTITDRYEALKDSKKSIETELSAVEATLKQAIGDAETAMLPSGVSYTYKAQARKSYVVAEGSFRVLRRKEPK